MDYKARACAVHQTALGGDTYSDNGALIFYIVALLLIWRRNTPHPTPPHPAQLTKSLGSLTCHKIPPQICVRRLNPVYTLWPHTIEIHFNIILQFVVSSGPFPSYFPTKFPYAFLSHSCLSTSPSNLSVIFQVSDEIVGRAEFCWYCDPLGFIHRILGVYRRFGWASFIFQPSPTVLQPSSVFRSPDLRAITTQKITVPTVHVNIYTGCFFNLHYEVTLPEYSINAISKTGRLCSRKTGLRFVHLS